MKRDLCKKEYDRMKHGLKDKRERYQDLHIDLIMQNMEARIMFVDKEIQEIKKLREREKIVKKEKEKENVGEEGEELAVEEE